MFGKKVDNLVSFDDKNFRRFNFDKFIVNVSVDLIEYLKKQRVPQFEKGGYLFGYKIFQTNELTITSATQPFTKDSQKYGEFEISSKHKKYAKKVLTTENLIVGFWHTHPTGCAALPSSLDMQLFDDIISVSKLDRIFNFIYNGNDLNIISYNKSKKIEVKKW